MISFFYTFDYDNAIKIPSSTQRSVLSCCGVREYAIAEKYDLKALAQSRFSTWVTSNWNHPEFYSVVNEVYNSTPSNDRGLRDLVESSMKENVTSVLKNGRFREMLTAEMGELGVAVLSAVLASCKLCPYCSNKLCSYCSYNLCAQCSKKDRML
jgi:speckle-type POZ protein